MHICHLTSVHPRYDSRIFLKMCKGMANRGERVTLIVADGNGNEVKQQVNIFDVGAPTGRLNRMWLTTKTVYKKALEIKPDIFHIHDPELLFVALKLYKKGFKVVFDSHEDTANTILVSAYLPSFTTKIISKLYHYLERFVCKRISGVVCATLAIEDIFVPFAKRTVNINNFPVLDKNEQATTIQEKPNAVCYVGSIGIKRGIKEMINAIDLVTTNTKLNLAGQYSTRDLEHEIKALKTYKEKVDDFGFVSTKEVENIYNNSIAGLITFHPIPTYMVGNPIKLFEYMKAGLPVIMSDFPYWRNLLKGYNCCIFVNGENPKEIAEAIDFLVKNKDKAQEMGEVGRILVYEKFDWKFEEKKLMNFYNLL